MNPQSFLCHVFFFGYFLSTFLFLVSGHGYVSNPTPRNVAVGNTASGANGPSVCGAGGQWVTGTWNSPEKDDTEVNGAASSPIKVYRLGENFEITFLITAPHMGHFQLELCRPTGNKITEDCFKTVLQRDPTDSLHSPFMKNFPHLFFFPDNSCAANRDLTARFIIPAEFGECEHCIMRWYWQTGNSCKSHPYQDVTAPLPPSEYSNWSNGSCKMPQRHNAGPSCGVGCPHKDCLYEQFKNCIDVKIIPGDGSSKEVVVDHKPVNDSNVQNKPATNNQMNGNGCNGGSSTCVQLFDAERCNTFCTKYCEVNKRYSKGWCN